VVARLDRATIQRLVRALPPLGERRMPARQQRGERVASFEHYFPVDTDGARVLHRSPSPRALAPRWSDTGLK
jgi:hypothetical protein